MINGLYFAIAEKRTLIDGKKFEPLWPVDQKRQGRVINVFFNPFGRLELDTTLVSDPGNYGFSIVDPAGNAIPIKSVTARQRSVSVLADADVPTGSKLRYAFIGGATHEADLPETRTFAAPWEVREPAERESAALRHRIE